MNTEQIQASVEQFWLQGEEKAGKAFMKTFLLSAQEVGGFIFGSHS